MISVLEEHLDMSLREILPKIHSRIVDGSTTYFGIYRNREENSDSTAFSRIKKLNNFLLRKE